MRRRSTVVVTILQYGHFLVVSSLWSIRIMALTAAPYMLPTQIVLVPTHATQGLSTSYI
jgi:hypothetical protein